jgi:ribosomal protein L1
LPASQAKNNHHLYLWQCRRHFPLVPPPWERKPHYSIAEACDLILQQEGHDFYKLSYEVNVNLNVDPRLGEDQIIKGVFELPHPSNKKNFRVIALTTDPDLALLALQAGALYAGDLGDLLTEEFLCRNRIKMVVATQELENAVVRKSKQKSTKLSRILKRLHLTPAPEFRTLVAPEAFIENVRRFVLGTYTRFQNDLHGNVTVALGKVGVRIYMHWHDRTSTFLDYIEIYPHFVIIIHTISVTHVPLYRHIRLPCWLKIFTLCYKHW